MPHSEAGPGARAHRLRTSVPPARAQPRQTGLSSSPRAWAIGQQSLPANDECRQPAHESSFPTFRRGAMRICLLPPDLSSGARTAPLLVVNGSLLIEFLVESGFDRSRIFKFAVANTMPKLRANVLCEEVKERGRRGVGSSQPRVIECAESEQPVEVDFSAMCDRAKAFAVGEIRRAAPRSQRFTDARFVPINSANSAWLRFSRLRAHSIRLENCTCCTSGTGVSRAFSRSAGRAFRGRPRRGFSLRMRCIIR